MTRQAFTRILLSLLLLITQQMAATHAMSHWRAGLGGEAVSAVQVRGHQGSSADSAESDLSRAFALDQTCDQCLAFAHMVGPLGHTPRTFAPPDLIGNAVLAAAGQPVCARTICAFRSRAPPQA